jgi:hypothetical protein
MSTSRFYLRELQNIFSSQQEDSVSQSILFCTSGSDRLPDPSSLTGGALTLLSVVAAPPVAVSTDHLLQTITIVKL